MLSASLNKKCPSFLHFSRYLYKALRHIILHLCHFCSRLLRVVKTHVRSYNCLLFTVIFPTLHALWIVIYKLLGYLQYNPVFWLENQLGNVILDRKNENYVRNYILIASERERERERERDVLFNDALNTFYLRLYDVRLRTILIVRKETRCRHIGYSNLLTARVLLYAPSHRQDNTYHGLCYTSRGALAGTRNSSMGF